MLYSDGKVTENHYTIKPKKKKKHYLSKKHLFILLFPYLEVSLHIFSLIL
ncbi:hypothetical protein HMPREF1860_01673 [Prevotella amnii]|uniref:Uncharacterized protein n=1 Tax=Prevotella amnii TaxID=419005 RepID=A0A134B7U7_9BACT|nr:hypothetical protein HMPREF1860_01673 [Prevotella amnii]